MDIRSLPKDDRPRERLAHLGAHSSSSQELLALILGKGTRGESVFDVIQKLLQRFGSLDGVLRASLADLMSIRGLGLAKSTQLLACVEIAKRLSIAELDRLQNKELILSAEDIARLARFKITDQSKEHLVVFCFDVRQRLLVSEIVSIGILDANLVHPREIFTFALRQHAASIIITHNHPSGDPTPSDEDVVITKRIADAGALLGIFLLDHVVVGEGRYVSMLEEGLL